MDILEQCLHWSWWYPNLLIKFVAVVVDIESQFVVGQAVPEKFVADGIAAAADHDVELFAEPHFRLEYRNKILVASLVELY